MDEDNSSAETSADLDWLCVEMLIAAGLLASLVLSSGAKLSTFIVAAVIVVLHRFRGGWTCGVGCEPKE